MAEYDGEIRINTRIDTNGIIQGMSEIRQVILRGMSASKPMQKTENELKLLGDSFSDTAKKASELQTKMISQKDVQIPTKEYSDLQKEFDSLQKKLISVYDSQERFLATGGKEESSTYKKMIYDAETLERKLQGVERVMQSLVESGKAFTLGADSDAEYMRQAEDNIKRVLDRVEERWKMEEQTPKELLQPKVEKISPGSTGYNEDAIRFIEEYASKINKTTEKTKKEAAEEERLAQIRENAIVRNEKIVEIMERRKQIQMELKDLEKAGVTQGYEDYDSRQRELSQINQQIKDYEKSTETAKAASKKLAESARNALSTISKYAKKSSRAMASFAASSMRKAVSSMFSFGKSTKSTNNTLEKGFKAVLKYGLGIRSFYILINRFRTAVKEGFKNLAQFSDGTNAALSSLKSSLTQLKNSFATAFNPILTAAAPALTALINMVSRAVTYVGMLIAALTGKGTFTKAKEVQEDYAASLDKSADSAKNAKKESDKYLSGLDEVKRYESAKDSDSGDSGGYKAPTPGEMFEEVDIPSQIGNIAEMIKKAWEDADFTGIGSMIGTKLKGALENIPWDTIQATAAKVGKSFATLINGFVEVDGLGYTIGKTIGEAINTGIIGINSFLDNTHWDSVGKFIGEGLNGIIGTIDWKGLGHLFAAKFNAIFETIGEASRTFKWTDFGKNLATSLNTFIKDFKWEENGAHLGELVKGILDTLITFLEETNWQELGENIADFIGSIDWTGIMERLAEGIGAALGGFAALIWGIIKDSWDDVVKWWHDVAFEDGEFTIEGLLNGIWEGVKNIGQWIYDHIFKPFIDGFKKAFGIHSPSTVMADQGGYIISGLLDGLKNNIGKVIEWLKNIPGWFKEKFDMARDKVHDAFNGIGGWFEDKFSNAYKKATGAFQNAKIFFTGVWSGIKDAFGNISNWFKDKFSAAWQAVKDVFSAGGQIFDGIKDGILNGLKAVINALIDGINSVITIPFNGINYALRSIKGVNIMGFTPFSWIQTIDVPQIPRLATGAVIPPNKEFLAVLGDQKHGTNIEAPEGLIRKIVREETQGMQSQQGGKAVYSFIAQINRRVVFNEVIEEGKLRQTIHGRNPFDLA